MIYYKKHHIFYLPVYRGFDLSAEIYNVKSAFWIIKKHFQYYFHIMLNLESISSVKSM